MLNVGQRAPSSIALPIFENGVKRIKSLSDFRGKKLVLYFYPKDGTPGCTKEACSFQDVNEEIRKLGAQVVGVSKDAIDSHRKFAEEHNLAFPLFSDSENKLAKASGLLEDQNIITKKLVGGGRKTFVIDEEGFVIKIWPNVNPDEHTKEVLEFLRGSVK